MTLDLVKFLAEFIGLHHRKWWLDIWLGLCWLVSLQQVLVKQRKTDLLMCWFNSESDNGTSAARDTGVCWCGFSLPARNWQFGWQVGVDLTSSDGQVFVPRGCWTYVFLRMIREAATRFVFSTSRWMWWWWNTAAAEWNDTVNVCAKTWLFSLWKPLDSPHAEAVAPTKQFGWIVQLFMYPVNFECLNYNRLPDVFRPCLSWSQTCVHQ